MKVANSDANTNTQADSNNSKSPSKQDLTEDPSDTFSDVEITVACPDSNDSDGKSLVELQMSAEVRQAYLYRNAKICCAVLILVALLATSVILGVVLQNESPDKDAQVLPISQSQAAQNDKEKESPSSSSSSAAYPMFCTKDARLCSDWSTVGRNPDNNCVFDACPEGTCWVEHLVTCDDGVTKVCNSKSLCPESQVTEEQETRPSTSEESAPPACPREMKMCSDLTFVTFSGPSCELSACPEGSCLVDSFQCPDGTMVGRNVDKNCEFSTCPTATEEEDTTTEEPECTREIRFCNDGKFVVRDTRTCQFPPCPNN